MSKPAAPLDPRAICNAMLDEAARNGLALTNLSLQKLLYFAHATHLATTKRPLVSGYFEAWQLGPVHPAAYSAFKSAGARAITFRAERSDPLSGVRTGIAAPTEPEIHQLVCRTISSLGVLPAHRLVEISHARNAPWHFVVTEATNTMAFGLRIPDNLILERYRFHKVSVGADSTAGELGEDAPFTGHGLGEDRASAS